MNCSTTIDLLLAGLGALGAILRTALLAIINAQTVETAAHDVVAHAGKVAHLAASHEHDRMLLQVVAFAADVRRDLLAVGQANTCNLAERRVGLLGGLCLDLQAHTSALRAAIEIAHLALARLHGAGLANELIDRRHCDGHPCRANHLHGPGGQKQTETHFAHQRASQAVYRAPGHVQIRGAWAMHTPGTLGILLWYHYHHA